jgi:hypothetical protein
MDATSNVSKAICEEYLDSLIVVDDNKNGYTSSYKSELHQMSNKSASNDEGASESNVNESIDESSEDEEGFGTLKLAM